MTKECTICGTLTNNLIGFCPEHDPSTALLSKSDIEGLVERTYDTMSDPNTDPEVAQAAYDDHVRYIQMLEELDQ